MTEQILLGQDRYCTIIFAEMKDGKIRGFSGYDYISSADSYDNNRYLSMCQWTHEVEINGVTYKSGMLLDENKITPFFKELDLEGIIKNENFYFAEGSYCAECGIFHDTADQYMGHSFVIVDCEVFCNDCVSTDDMLTEIMCAKDLFSAKNISNMESPENYQEVETLFCDSSGFGSSMEAALTQEQAENRTNELLDEHGILYAGLTGIGQFQVYVTLYKPRDEAKTS